MEKAVTCHLEEQAAQVAGVNHTAGFSVQDGETFLLETNNEVCK